MSRTEENDELIDTLYKQLSENPFTHDVDVKAVALLDISKSLAVIADELRKEEQNND